MYKLHNLHLNCIHVLLVVSYDVLIMHVLCYISCLLCILTILTLWTFSLWASKPALLYLQHFVFSLYPTLISYDCYSLYLYCATISFLNLCVLFLNNLYNVCNYYPALFFILQSLFVQTGLVCTVVLLYLK